LLRPGTRASCAVLLAAAALGLAAPALAGGAAPDPSPASGTVAPDPYPAAPVQHIQAPASAPAATVVRRPPRTHRAAPRKPRAATPVTATPAAPRLHRPDGPAPSLAGRVAQAVAPEGRVSRGLALAVALLVLVSATLVAGAAREVAR
jgi:hypothetical protein